MLIGTQMAEDGTILQEQARLAERIEASLDRIRAENRQLTADLADQEARLQAEQQFVDTALGVLVAGALPQRQVAVYVADTDAPEARRVQMVLEQADADIAVHSVVQPPAADVLNVPYVLLWTEEWGEPPPDLVAALPAGGVIARPTAWMNAEAAVAAGDVVGAVEYAATPHGLLSLVQQLQGGPGVVVDLEQFLMERWGR